MRSWSKKAVALAGAVAVVVGLGGCATSDPTDVDTGPAIKVGSFAFPESEILAEIYAQVLEAEGLKVDRSFNLGPRQTTIPALEDGSIDVIPEYNGNLLFYYAPDSAARTTSDVNAELKKVIPEGFQVLDSSQAEDKDAYVITRATADEFGIASIGDLAKLGAFSLGANPQFGELGYGIPGLKNVYGVTSVTFVPIEDFGGPDTVKALVDGTVQVADIYTTSPALTANDLVVLDDPKSIIAAQNIVPMLRSSIYSIRIANALNNVSNRMTTEDLIELRTRVEGDEKAQPATVAKEWLKAEGIVS